jgi:hypothetical protein
MPLADWCDTFRGWLNREDDDYPDSLVTTFIRMAEADLSDRLRCADQIAIDTSNVSVDRVQLPSDWRELDFVRIVDGYPLEFCDRTNFYAKSPEAQKRHYTLTGNFLLVGGPPTVSVPRQVEISYYEAVTPLLNVDTWLQVKYPNLFLPAVMVSASAYGVEDERAQGFEAKVQGLVDTINEKHKTSKSSGSRLRRNFTKGFD